jgi:hypothetical protein
VKGLYVVFGAVTDMNTPKLKGKIKGTMKVPRGK